MVSLTLLLKPSTTPEDNAPLAHRDLAGMRAIGLEEVAWKKGHKYLTLVYQVDEGRQRLLWIGQDRTEASLRKFFDGLGAERAAQIEFLCSDMWKPYLILSWFRAKGAAPRVHVARPCGAG